MILQNLDLNVFFGNSVEIQHKRKETKNDYFLTIE